MKKVLRIIGWSLLGIVAFVLIFYTVAVIQVKGRLSKVYQFKTETVPVVGDSASVANGKHLAAIRGCLDCHGDDFGGKLMNEDFMLGTLASANLTRGKGGLPSNYTTIDWVRAFRHGVGMDGKGLLMMPSHETTQFSEKDLGDIIAFANQLPPVDRTPAENKLGPIIYLMTFLDKFPLLNVETIDHNKPMQRAPKDPIEQGKYLSITCHTCHRPDMKGGDPLAPGMKPPPNVTATGQLKNMSAEQFTAVLRTGKTPDGRQLNNDDMPWLMTQHYTDDEISALYSYLKSITN